jgi:hypothetical protein
MYSGNGSYLATETSILRAANKNYINYLFRMDYTVGLDFQLQPLFHAHDACYEIHSCYHLNTVIKMVCHAVFSLFDRMLNPRHALFAY